MKKIIGIGNALVDALVQVESEDILAELALPKGSMQLLDTPRYEAISARMAGVERKRATGGSVGNAILALANLGASPAFVGKIGTDDNGRFYMDNAKKKGITPLLVQDAHATGVANAFVTPDGERTFGTYLGAAAHLTADDLRPEMFEGYNLLFIEGYLVQNHALIRRAAELAKAAGLETAIDLASYNIVEEERTFFAELLPLIDIVFANEEESCAYTGKSPHEAVAELAKICPIAVVKIGAKGVLVQQGNAFVQVPSLPVEKVVDTTGAGDFFAAGFLYNYARGCSMESCATLGSLLAGNVVQHLGTTLPETTWEAIRNGL